MITIEQALNELKEEFSEFEDGFDRYSYLVELAAFLPPYPEEKRTEDRLVQGCQSHVWLDIEIKNGRFYFGADSDTLIIKGMLYVLWELLWEQSVEAVAAAELEVLSAIGLTGSFSSDRQKGNGYIIQRLQAKAQGV